MEYRLDNPGEFNFFTMLNQGEIEFCNTMPFWITFQKFEISTFYQSKHLGSSTVQPLTVDPYSSVVKNAVFTSNVRNSTYFHDI